VLYNFNASIASEQDHLIPRRPDFGTGTVRMSWFFVKPADDNDPRTAGNTVTRTRVSVIIP
jgi:hypothetical protein